VKKVKKGDRVTLVQGVAATPALIEEASEDAVVAVAVDELSRQMEEIVEGHDLHEGDEGVVQIYYPWGFAQVRFDSGVEVDLPETILEVIE